MNNLRVRQQEVITHEDFEFRRGPPSVETYDLKDRRDRVVANRIKEGYYDFAMCWWGRVGNIVEIGEEKGGNYWLIKDISGTARKTLEEMDWNIDLLICNGAPHLTEEMLIRMYDQQKNSEQRVPRKDI